MFNIKLSLYIAGSLIAASLASCSAKKHPSEETTKFLVSSPLQKDTVLIKEYVCQIRAIQHIELRALEKGYLQNIYIDEGKFVRKGQTLFQTMPLLYKAELQKAQAEVQYAQIEYKNTQSLASRNVVSQNELALAKAKLEKALAELSLAQVHLGFTEIKAPFDGIIDRFQVRLGSLVNEGDLLTTLSDNSKMWVYFNVPESEYLSFQSDHPSNQSKSVSLVMANNELFKYPGIVETIEADFNNETGNIAFRATFPNPEKLLRHGETGNIRMTTPIKNALLIPQKATFEILEKKYVFVIDQQGFVHSREIAIAAEMPDIYVIKEGLNAHERILIEGIRKVKDGQKIIFEYQNPSKVLSNLKVYSE